MLRFGCFAGLLTIALAASPATALVFQKEALDGATLIIGTGTIAESDPAVFSAMAASAQSPVIAVFDSGGGNIVAAMELAKTIRGIGAATYMPPSGKCLSACFLAFIGGTDRLVEDGAKLGSHQFYWNDDSKARHPQASVATQHLSASILRHMIDMGVKADALPHIMDTPPEKMFVFTSEQLEAYHIVTDRPEASSPFPATPATTKSGCPFPKGFEVSDPLGLYPNCR